MREAVTRFHKESVWAGWSGGVAGRRNGKPDSSVSIFFNGINAAEGNALSLAENVGDGTVDLHKTVACTGPERAGMVLQEGKDRKTQCFRVGNGLEMIAIQTKETAHGSRPNVELTVFKNRVDVLIGQALVVRKMREEAVFPAEYSGAASSPQMAPS